MNLFPAIWSSRQPLRAACLSALVMWSGMGTALADTFDGPITVKLIAPGGLTNGTDVTPDPINLTQTLAPGDRISNVTGGDIGNAMLSTLVAAEFIELVGTSIHVTAMEGANNGTTGYLGLGGQHARYEFNDLNIGGQQIVDLSYTLSDGFGPSAFLGVDNLSALTAAHFIRLTSPHSVELDLDQLHFTDRGTGESNNFANISINLVTSPVPEPGSLPLACMGIASVAAVARLRQRRRTRARA